MAVLSVVRSENGEQEMIELIIRYAEPKAGEADSVVRPMEVMGELVRCKDCEYRDKTKVNKKGFEVCVASGMDMTDNDFCSLAKMKGGTK